MASYQYIYTMQNLSKILQTGKKIIQNVNLSFLPGAKIGVIGHNGAGKSTVLKIMAGLDKDYTGEAFLAEGATVGYLAQEPQLDNSKTVKENVMLGLGSIAEDLEKFNDISMQLGEVTDNDEMMKLLEEQGELQERIDAADGWDLDRTLAIAMDALNCPPADSSVKNLSGGEKRRIALCQLLLSKPDMLLLDEPTNHLDASSISWLERHLEEYKGTVVTITHDRYFLDNVAEWILELERGNALPFKGNYTEWLDQKQKRLAQEDKEEDARQKTIKEELEWVRQSPKARQTKSKARLAAYEELLQQAGDRAPGPAQIVIPIGPRLGGKVIEAKNVSKSFGDKQLMDSLSFELPPGGIIGVIGPNGAGKTTLFKMITGAEQPDSGTFKVGETVKLGYVDQSRDDLDDKKAVWDVIADGQELIMLGDKEVNSRMYTASFNFKGQDQQKKVGLLSGGERNRVHLARMLKSGANLILLDEPTNDLDVDTLRALEEALYNFAGCAVVISHDRWFLDRIATHILAFEGNGNIEWFAGNYQDYEEDRKRRLGDEEKTGKYKKLARA